MNQKANALEYVRLQAETYFEDQTQAKESRVRLVRAVKKAREVGSTQQSITDACRIDDNHKLSRQRIAQLEKENV